MTFFRDFLEFRSHNKISVVLDSYEQMLAERLQSSVGQDDYVQSTEAEKLAIEESLLAQHYPRVNNFMLALESMNPHKIDAAYRRYQQWSGRNTLPAPLLDFKAKALYGSNPGLNVQEAIRLLLHQTSKNMHCLGKIIEMAISKIPDWKAKVVIQPKLPNTEWTSPVDKAIVEICTPPTSGLLGCALLPGGLQLWQIDSPDLEVDADLQRQYAALLRELYTPGGERRKLMTLYFSAPPSERGVYREARRRLSFLGNAELCPPPLCERACLAEEQDVWKVRVDSGYLIETSPGVFEAHGEIPIRYLELIHEAE